MTFFSAMAFTTPPTRHSTREGQKRTKAIINMYGPTNDDEEDGDFTPMKKRSRMEAGLSQSSDDNTQDIATVESTLSEQMEISPPMVLVRSGSRATTNTRNALAEVEIEKPIDSPTNKTKKQGRHRATRSVGQIITPQRRKASPTNNRGCKGQVTPMAPIEHQPNSSQALSHRLKPSDQPSSAHHQGYESSHTVSAEPEPQISSSIDPIIPHSVETNPHLSGMSQERLKLEVEYLKRKVEIHEGDSVNKHAEFLEAENTYLQKKIGLAKETYPGVTDRSKQELAILRNEYLKGMMALFPNMD